LLLVSNKNGTHIYYVKPSSLMVIKDSPSIRTAAEQIDENVAKLVASVSGNWPPIQVCDKCSPLLGGAAQTSYSCVGSG
jgi:hypothetical protein